MVYRQCACTPADSSASCQTWCETECCEEGEWRSVPRLKAVSHPRLSHNVVGSVLVRFEFLSQLAYQYAQVFRLLDAVLAPDRPQQSTLRENLARLSAQASQNT